MRPTHILATSLMLLVGANLASAQEPRDSSAPRLQFRASSQEQPTLREALADEDVQSALRVHVRGIDIADPFSTYPDFPLTSELAAGDDDDGTSEIRELSDGQLEGLRRRGTGERTRPRTPGNLQEQLEEIIEPLIVERLRLSDGRPHLDVELFGEQLEALLQNNVNGYVFRLRQHGQNVFTRSWGWAQSPEDATMAWDTDTRQHVASVSKLITAIGLAHLLDANNVDFDEYIIDYLPDYWAKGPDVDQITFAHLMNHISGFNGPDSGTSNFILMRARVGQGVDGGDVGNWQSADYENMNFGLCRILMATLGGYIDADATFGIYSDVIWNWISVVAYSDYIDTNVFAPAGVTDAVMANSPSSARAYAWDDNGPGWDSGFLMGEAGGASWHLSIDELLDVLGEFRRGGTVVSPQEAIGLMNASYGLSSPVGGWSSPAGPFYFKPGRWWNGAPDFQAEQSFVMVLPEDMEFAIFVNSPLGPADVNLRDLVGWLYLQSIVE